MQENIRSPFPRVFRAAVKDKVNMEVTHASVTVVSSVDIPGSGNSAAIGSNGSKDGKTRRAEAGKDEAFSARIKVPLLRNSKPLEKGEELFCFREQQSKRQLPHAEPITIAKLQKAGTSLPSSARR